MQLHSGPNISENIYHSDSILKLYGTKFICMRTSRISLSSICLLRLCGAQINYLYEGPPPKKRTHSIQILVNWGLVGWVGLVTYIYRENNTS